MAELASYLKKRIKPAVKSVFYNRRQYLCFFIAMLVTEIFCGLVVMSAHNNNVLEREYIGMEYDHHLVLRNLNSQQYYYMLNDEYTVFSSDHIYDTVKVEKRKNLVTGEPLYSMHIKFTGNPRANYKTFSKRYFYELTALDEKGKLSISTTALYNVENRVKANSAGNILFFLLTAALSTALVTSLYNIRINYYKFEYGIYMTFGADFKRLFSASLWEMLVIAVIVYIPATIISWLASRLIYTTAGQTYSFYAAAPFIILAFSLIVAAVSVLMPVWRLSRRTPMSNITAADNSDLVVSPRISFEMLGKTYPRGYSLISAWRFRLYGLRLYLVVSLFTALFVAMVYSAGLIDQKNNLSLPQFNISFAPGGVYSYDGGNMRGELLEIEGITGITKQQTVKAWEMRSHLMADKKNVMPFANYVIPEEGMRATNFADYHPADSEIVEWLSEYDADGKLSSVLTDEKTVIISDSASNAKRLKIKPGDKIQIAKVTGIITRPPDFMSGNELLKEELRLCTFDYIEYTVGAVIHNLPTKNNLDIFFSNADFTALTGTEVVYNSVGIAIDQSLTIGEVRQLEEELGKWADYYSNAGVANAHILSEKNLTLAKRGTAVLTCIAVMLLTVTPLVWFFSQIMFYFKREGEFTVLLAFGGLMSEARRQFIFDGIISAVSSGLILALFIWLLPSASFIAANRIFVTFSGLPLRYIYSIPWAAGAIGMVLGIACAFLSCYIPFILFSRRARLTSVTESADALYTAEH